MLYDRYQEKIMGVVRVIGQIRRFRVLILTVISAIIALTAGFLATRGIVYGGGDCPATVSYGEPLAYTANAMFSNVRYEYRAEDSETWSEEVPSRAGNYYVRAVAKASFGRERYGDQHAFTILPRALTVRIKEDSVLYGTLPTVTGDALMYHDTVECDAFQYADMTKSTTEVTPVREAVVLRNAAGEDVTDSYMITVATDELTFTQRPLTITVAPATMQYNGEALTSQIYEVSEGTLADGDTLLTYFNCSQIEVGETPNEPTVRIMTAKGLDVTGQYAISKIVGKLTVEKRIVIVTTEGGSFVYDGTAHQNSNYTIDSTTPLLLGHSEHLIGSPSITDVGECVNLLNLDIRNADGESVKDRYYFIQMSGGTLSVTSRNITVVSGGAEKIYDGTVLVMRENHAITNTASYEGLASGETIELIYGNSLLNVGEIDNSFTVVIRNAAGGETTDNYCIDRVYGKLKITPRAITVTSDSDQKIYDGTALTCHSYTLTGELADLQTADPAYPVSLTDVGTAANSVSMTIRDSAWADVTANYDITYIEGTLTVEHRPITVRAVGATRIYDGTPLYHEEISVLSALGIVSGQTYCVSARAEQTDVGQIDNVLEIRILEDEIDKTANYTITYDTPEKLTVTSRPITVTSVSDQKIYDGTPLTNDGYTLSEGGLAPGHSEDVTVTGGILYVGDAANTVAAVQIFDAAGEDVTRNYTVTPVAGVLTVCPRSMTVTADSNSKKYDGTPLTDAGFEIGGDGLAENERIEVSVFGSQTYVGNSANTVIAWQVFNANQEDVSANYAVSLVAGTLEIIPRPITVTSGSADKYYDGTPLTNSDYTVGGDGLADREVLDVTFTGSATDVPLEGNVAKNTFSVVIKADGVDTTDNYEITLIEGELLIKPRPITVTSGSGQKIYDGQTLINDTCTVSNEVGMGLASGQSIRAIPVQGITDVGEIDNIFTVVISDALGTDTTRNYEITYVYGKLIITPRPITVTSGSAEKYYDGTALKNLSYTLSTGEQEGLVAGHYEMVEVTGSILYVGSTSNTIARVYIIAAGRDVTHNYQIICAEGTLTILAREITLQADSHEKVYDGTPLTDSDVTVGGMGLAAGEELVVTVEGSQTDVGSSFNRVTAWSVRNADGVDVTDNYRLTERLDGILTVTARPITVISGSDEKVYDGTELIKHTYSIGTENGSLGLAPNQSLEATYTGSILNVGRAENTFTVVIRDAAGRDVTGNYTVTLVYGELKITPRPITVVSGSAEKVYDGAALTEHTYTVDTANGGFDIVIGHRVTPSFTGFRTDVGESPNLFTISIVNADGTDMNGNYAVSYVYGTLKVTPFKLWVATGSADKIYDGDPLTCGEYTILRNTTVNGHRLVVKITGQQTVAGSSANTCVITVVDAAGQDVTHNYDWTTQLTQGTLTVFKCTVAVITGSAEKTYDGTPLTRDEWSSPDWEETRAFINGHILTVTVTGERTAVGSSDNTFEVVITDAEGNDVTDSFEILSQPGTLTVTLAGLTFSSGSDSKIYDGKPLTYEVWTLIEGCLMQGHTPAVTFTGTITNVGTAENTLQVKILDVAGRDVTSMYPFIDYEPGTLEVTRRAITVEAADAVKEYDGTPLEAPLAIQEPNLMLDALNAGVDGGFTWEVTGAAGSQTELGSSTSAITGIKIYLNGEEVTDNFDITCDPGTLTVVAATIRVYLYELTKYYDGTPLSYLPDDWYCLNIPEGCTLTLELEGSLTEVGMLELSALRDAMAAKLIVTKDGVDVTDNYYLVLEGTPLTVKARPVQITAASAEKVYDGEALEKNEYAVTQGTLVSGHHIDLVQIVGSQTEVGQALNTITAVVIRDAEGNDVTANYDLDPVSGTLNVLPENEQ